MDTGIPTMNDLFAQLGLSSDLPDIERFIASHNPLPENIRLHEAPFWNPAQATFLKEEVQEDSGWAELIEHLNVSLRAPEGELPGSGLRDSL